MKLNTNTVAFKKYSDRDEQHRLESRLRRREELAAKVEQTLVFFDFGRKDESALRAAFVAGAE